MIDAAAIHHHALAGHEIARRGCQKEDRADQIIGHFGALEGAALDHGILDRIAICPSSEFLAQTLI